jgi:hypothetical protein
MTGGSKHTTGFVLHILQASLGGANPVFFLLESANHLPKPVRPLCACGAVRFLRREGREPANNRGGTRAATDRDGTQGFECSKNPCGADALAASVSVLRTVTQTGVASTIDW